MNEGWEMKHSKIWRLTNELRRITTKFKLKPPYKEEQTPLNLEAIFTAKIPKERIIEVADEVNLAYMELTRDVVFHKIPKEQYFHLINSALNIGREMANRIAEEFCSRNPVSIAQKMMVKIEYVPRIELIGSKIVYSEYVPKPPTIILYKGSISLKNKFIEVNELRQMFPQKDIILSHIAHELFHHIEETRIGRISEKFTITTLNMGFIKVKSGINALREISAHAFANSLLNIKGPPPRILDFFICSNWIDNYRKMQEFKKMLESKRITVSG